MTPVRFEELLEPTLLIAQAFDRWENDPQLVPFIRPNRTKEELEARNPVTVTSLRESLKTLHLYLIYRGAQLVGQMSYQVDPPFLLKKVENTAWIGIIIGESEARGQGIGKRALTYLEHQVEAHGLARIELGVFEFNEQAIGLYRKLGYQEIGRLDAFTYWQGRMWQDIRMEKYLGETSPH